MGYDLHVTRASHWTRTAGSQITEDEWTKVSTADPDLQQDQSNGANAVVWVDAEGQRRGWFDWYDGVVYTTDPDRATVAKLMELATRLGARVQGDSGEFYAAVEDWETRR